jgi:hypothetical protein
MTGDELPDHCLYFHWGGFRISLRGRSQLAYGRECSCRWNKSWKSAKAICASRVKSSCVMRSKERCDELLTDSFRGQHSAVTSHLGNLADPVMARRCTGDFYPDAILSNFGKAGSR